MAKFTIQIADTKAAKLRLANTVLECHLKILDSIQDDEREVQDWTIVLDIPNMINPEYVEQSLSPITMYPKVEVGMQMMESE
jgi:hypothetical protein